MSTEELHREIGQLKERIDQLERERTELVQQTNTALAAAQTQLYWLDRWQIDLNRLMKKPSALFLLNIARFLKAMAKKMRSLKQKLTPGKSK